MDDPNVTCITFEGYVEMQKYRYLYFVIMLSAFVTILYSNGTVVYIIYAHQDLHQPMDAFIAVLLVNSLLYGVAVYPKLLLDSLLDRQVTTYPVCLFQWFMFYSLAGSEFLLLAVMAYDRYVAICNPLQYLAIMRRRTVGLLLAASWFLPSCCNAALSARQKLCRFSINGILCSSPVHSLLPGRRPRAEGGRTVLIMTFQVIMYHPLFNPFVYGLKMKEISKHLSAHFRLGPLNASV